MLKIDIVLLLSMLNVFVLLLIFELHYCFYINHDIYCIN